MDTRRFVTPRFERGLMMSEEDRVRLPNVTRRRLLLAGVAAAVVAFVGARAHVVNSKATPRPETIAHGMGEWVELAGAYIETGVAERTAGYSIRVSSISLCSYNEYVNHYANDGSVAIDGLDIPSIAIPEFEIRNDDSEGYLQIATMYLVPKRKNEFFLSDRRLLVKTEPKMRESGNPGMTVNIRQGTEYLIHPGYVHQGGTTEYDGQEIQEAYLDPIRDKSFELIVSNAPVRHVIEVTI